MQCFLDSWKGPLHELLSGPLGLVVFWTKSGHFHTPKAEKYFDVLSQVMIDSKDNDMRGKLHKIKDILGHFQGKINQERAYLNNSRKRTFLLGYIVHIYREKVVQQYRSYLQYERPSVVVVSGTIHHILNMFSQRVFFIGLFSVH